MSRHGRRNWPRPQTTTRPAPSSSSGTPTPDPDPSPLETDADIIPWPKDSPTVGAQDQHWQTFYGPVVIDQAALELPENLKSRRTLEALGFVFPGPGEAFGALGGLGPPPDPLEERVRRELGLE
jgi:hypothetical protein